MPALLDSFLVAFDSPATPSLADLGGKGANLTRLAHAGFPVPRGLILTTAAYRACVTENHLYQEIEAALQGLPASDLERLEQASVRIRAAFSRATIPPNIRALLLEGYAAFNGTPVAVRSSATTEDLPDLSFAGQQDTFLNVTGEAQLLEAVVNCWSSLWTARAIGYRLRNCLPQDDLALAVIIQEMVISGVSGVLFTANPVTGLLSESVINATFGLGEALVSGQVEPDQFVVDVRSGEIRQKSLGSKLVSTRGKAGGGVELRAEDSSQLQTLAEDEIRQLVRLGQRIQQEYGAPQDIEWAMAGGEFAVLQARPVTSLFPIPIVSFDPLEIWFSFGSVQGVVGPFTPLGQDGIRNVFMGSGKLFGVTLNPTQKGILASAGERLWIKISDLLRNPIGQKVITVALDYIDPGVARIVQTLALDPGLSKGRVKPSTLFRAARFFVPAGMQTARNMLFPSKARARFDAAIEGRLRASRIPPAPDRFNKLANTVAFIQAQVADALGFLLPKFIPVFAPAMASLNLLFHLTKNGTQSLEVTRGLDNNVTTQMDLALWQTACAIRADAEAARQFQTTPTADLARHYIQRTLPEGTQAAVESFLLAYGMRGVGEIDMGRPRWREDPTPVIQTLQSYLQIPPEAAPDVIFERGRVSAMQAIEQLAADVRRTKMGWLKEKVVRGAAKRVRLFIGARESPKFFAIRMMGIARSALLEAGGEFAAAGTLERANDLVFLTLSEMDSLARNEPRDWKALVAARRDAYQREQRRRQEPRMLASDGRAFYEGIGAQTDTEHLISGSPVSPGVAEGVVRVVLDPRATRLEPGEILVCPGTDPAWTPLFLSAAGLVTEVGGMMTHGSVVAREYGIPAVVGVHEATRRLKTGQRVRVDGSSGKIEVIRE
jgi:pyruvate,water dikinase